MNLSLHFRTDGLQVLPPSAAPTIVGLMQPKRRGWTTVMPILGLIAVLVAVGILQYRWSDDVSEAERDRLQQSLERSSVGFQAVFVRDMFALCRALQASKPRAPAVLEDRLVNRFMAWRRISGHAALVQGVYLWSRSDGTSSHLLRLNLDGRKLEPAPWPEPLQAMATRSSRTLPKQPRRWVWDERIPALIHPVYAMGPKGQSHLFGYVFVVFNAQWLEQVYLPTMARRSFPASNGFVFQLLSNQVEGKPAVVYRSEKDVPTEAFIHADAVFPLLERGPHFSPSSPRIQASSAGASPSTAQIVLSSRSPRWWIAVRHRAGSVDAAVRSTRYRDIAISAVVLLVLAFSLLALLIATRRARRLARLQMEFASGVSHELRTPLAVICSAAENLADGVVSNEARVRDYGEMIHREGQRLTGLVDHILDFAALHSDAREYPLAPTSVAEVIAAAVTRSRSMTESAGVRLESILQDDLPEVLTDPGTLGQCLQNLISNAVKYGGGGGRIQVEAFVDREEQPPSVSVVVRDFGAGIPPDELPHIFDPFYRGETVRSSAIRGTGLGLSLTREMIEALGGRITVESSLGEGSAFRLHVPVAPVSRPTHASASSEVS